MLSRRNIIVTDESEPARNSSERNLLKTVNEGNKMKRTPLRERQMPNYTVSEEYANMITHIIGGIFGIALLFVCIFTAKSRGNTVGEITGVVFSVSMIILYTVSSLYHGVRAEYAKRVLQVVDHCTIYLLIAGTYTPILLSGILPINKFGAVCVFAMEWGCAFTAATLTAIDLKRYQTLSMICYIAMGWGIVFILKDTVSALTPTGFAWLLCGGISYTLGAILYGLGKKKNAVYHTVFHVFVLIGSALQAISIVFYVL